MSTSTASTRHEQRAAVGRLLHQVQAGMVGELDNAVAPFDLSAAQYVVLCALASGRADTPSQLCREISYSHGAMTRMLDRLEHKGMIRRLRDPCDRRSVKLTLSDTCQQLFPEVLAAATAALEGFFQVHDRADLQQLENLLKPLLRPRMDLTTARAFAPPVSTCLPAVDSDPFDGFFEAARSPSFICHSRSRT